MPRSDLYDEPTAEEVGELYQWNQTAWGPQRGLDSRILKLIFNEHTVPVEDTNAPGRVRRYEPERMYLSEAGRIAELLRSLYPHLATVGYMWTGEGTRGDRERDANEFAMGEALDQLNPAIGGPNTADIWQKVALGRSADLIAPGDAYYWDFPHLAPGESDTQWVERWEAWRRQAPVPAVWLDLPAESTFPPSWGSIEDLNQCAMPRTWWDLVEAFSDDELAAGGVPDKTKDYGEEKTLIIHANRNWIYYGVGDREGGQGPVRTLRTVEHKMGRCAIRIQPGMTTGRREQKRYWLSMLFFVIDLIESLDRLGSSAATAAKMDAYPMLKWRRQPREGEEGGANVIFGANGDVITLLPKTEFEGEEDIEPVFQPQFGSKTQDLLAFTLDRVSRITGAADVLEGALGGTSEPAWSVNARQEMAKSKLTPLTKSVAEGHRDTADMVSRAVVAFGEKIPLFARTDRDRGRVVLDPEKLRGYETVITTDYQVRLPMNWRAEMSLAADLIQRTQDPNAPFPMSPFAIMEKFNIVEQPMLEFERWIHDTTLLSPDMIAALRKQKFQELQMEIAQDEGMSVEEFLLKAREAGLPEEAIQALLGASSVGGQPAAPGGGGRNGDLQGLVQAGLPFTQPAGGSQPIESVSPGF